MAYRVALVGNPNCGKTTLFNCLTGSNLYVGNWPGVTIEKKEGRIKDTKNEIILVDLPGIYSLAPYSMDEIVSRDFLIKEEPDLIINIIDASNIERNLYLTTQIMEMGIPIIGALNMMDVVERKGITIDCGVLEHKFGFPFMQISAQKERGIRELIEVVDRTVEETGEPTHYPPAFPSGIQTVFRDFENKISGQFPDVLPDYPGLFRSVKLIEQDQVIYQRQKEELIPLDAAIGEARQQIREISGQDVDGALADYRYRFITAGVGAAKKQIGKDTLAVEDRIDRILMNRFAALPIFFAFMFVIYFISINVVGDATSDLIQGFIANTVIPGVSTGLAAIQTADWLIDLITQGAITGVGAVLSFVPQITVLFIFISVLEDSGYMARVAFMMDRAFRRFGLSGKSFIPMVVGLGCSVPAIMATRTLENERDRKLTIILAPFISCGAKMPLYVLMASIFFPAQQSVMVFSLYLVSLLVVFVSGILLSKTKFKGASSDYLLELPPYRVPNFKNTMTQVWIRVKEFIIRAGTVIFLASVVMWFLQSFSPDLTMAANADTSILAAFGKFIAPVFIPLGFGNCVAVVSLLSGIAAKEMIISSMSVLLSSFQGGFTLALSQLFTPLSAYSYILFVLLASPCVASLATMRKELGNWRDFGFAIAYQIGTAYVVAMAVFQIGSLFIH